MYIHNIHRHNDIFNIINISSQRHYQHQHCLISMSFSTSISSHLVTTYRSAGGWGEKKGASSKKEKMRELPPTFIRGKTLEKPKRGLQNLRIRVRELFTQGKGISTPRARHKGWQPLIERAKHDLKIICFSFFIFYIFLGSTRVLPLLLYILRCDEEFRPM